MAWSGSIKGLKVFWCMALLSGLATAFHYTTDRTTGAPPSSTGAPAEQTCAVSGCHDSYTLDQGPGTAALLPSQQEQIYTPGATHTFTARIEQDTMKRFGFSVTVLSNADTTTAGKLRITDSARTQVMSGGSSFPDREYVTYTFYGTDPVRAGKGEWSFDWQAPAKDAGPVTFYLAALAANKDGTESGDMAYTTTQTLEAGEATAIIRNENVHALQLYPNPAHGVGRLTYTLTNASEIHITLYNGQGQLLQTVVRETQQSGIHHADMHVPDLAPGIYFVRLETSTGQITRKWLVR